MTGFMNGPPGGRHSDSTAGQSFAPSREAERDFRQVLAADPNAAGAYANLGVIHMRRKQWPQALAMLHKAEELAPAIAGIRLNIGLVYFRQNHFGAVPSALYGVVLLMAAIAYWVLQQTIIAAEGPASVLKKAVGTDWKGKTSPILYLVAVAGAFWSHWIAQAIYVFVALLWLVPDRRIERVLRQD